MQQRVSEPLFEITSFLEGHTTAWGIFEDRFGRLQRRFTVEMHGRWQGEEFFLDEHFVYDTGDTESRVWRVTPLGAGRFSATCDDCVGFASGRCDTGSIHMSYKFRLNLGARSIVVDLDDRIHRMSDDTAVNRATMRKWGIKLGELSLFFHHDDLTGEPASDAMLDARPRLVSPIV